MAIARLRIPFLLFFVCICFGCANIVPPTGGKKDVTPPRLLSVLPKDSSLNTRVSKIELRFDEYIAVADPIHEVQISPLLPIPLNVEAYSKRVVIRIPDSLLMANTTYRISFGKAIRDIHEENVFAGYSYIFSTTGYFDSLSLDGRVFDAFTGEADTGSMVLLYPASRSDSVVVREKPMYVVKTDGSGHFLFEGLPDQPFRIFALKDPNGNLTYDGGAEKVAFLDSTVRPGGQPEHNIRLNLFQETDSLAGRQTKPAVSLAATADEPKEESENTPEGFTYSVNLDTTDIRKRSFDITGKLDLYFSRKPARINAGRIHLSADSSGISVERTFLALPDSAGGNRVSISSNWSRNAVYTLRLLKGFAQDSAGVDAMPSRYTFRTRRDEDYAKLHIHLPSKYYGPGFVLLVLRDKDTIHHLPVTDTMVNLTYLAPGAYTIKVIVDRNHNGKWDSGDLFAGRQPEEIIPYSTIITLKAGWENLIDFEEINKKRPGAASSPRTRDTPRKE